MLLAGTALCAPAAFALAQAPAPGTLPTGGAVIAGQASIATPAPNRTQVTQGSDRAVIGWQSFSIGSGAAVDIRQPGAGSISVQQVQGNDPSRIFGQLSSNGRVVVANPNGVWFGPDARVDAAGIAAAAGRMSPGAAAQFMADGQVRLDQQAAPGAQVVNEGRITVNGGGLAALVGPSARNAGTIEARLGRVQIAGGSAATIDFDGDGLIAVRAAPGAIAENTGRISADGGRVRLSVAEAKGVLAGAVNMGGVVEARSVSADGGGITLGDVRAQGPTVTVTGRVDVSGQRGGSVTVVGEQVTVRSSARVDASGAQGGGTIRVGGDVRGAAGTRTARTTRVEEGATLAADATVSGNGGTVVLWADEATHFAGAISARGAGAGAGGFAEVSGAMALDYAGTADLRAPSGQWGTLLLDPANIVLVATGGTNTIPGPSTPGNVNLNASAVVSQLGLSNVDLFATNTISVNAPIAWSTGGTLRLNAAGVTVSQPVTATGAGGFVVRATGAVALNATVSLTSGAIDVQGASIRVGGPNNLRVGTSTGSVRLAGTAGDVIVASTSALRNTRVESDSGAIIVTASGDVIVRGANTTGSNFTGTWSRIAGGGSVTVVAGRDVSLATGTGDSGGNFARITAGTGMDITAGRDVIVGGAAATAMGVVTGTSIENASGVQRITTGGSLVVRAGGTNAASLVHSGGTQILEIGGAITVTANGSAAGITAAGGQTITAGSGISLTGGAAGGVVATIANASGDQSITTSQLMSVNSAMGAARVTNAGGAQTITAGSINLVAAAGVPVAIENTGGAQGVTATSGLIALTAANNGYARIAVAGGAQTVSAATTLSLKAANGTGTAAITANGDGQTISAQGAITLTGAGAAAFITAAGGPQSVSTEGILTLAAAATAVPLGLSDTTPTATPTPGSASIQLSPGTEPGVAAGAANQTITAAGIAFVGPVGAAAIGLQDWRAINDNPAAVPRYQSVLAGGTQLSVAGSATVFSLLPPPGPPPPPAAAGPGVVAAVSTVDAGMNALRMITDTTSPRPVAEALASGRGGFTPAGLAETEGFQPASVVVEGEDPATVFANSVLATRIEGLLPPPVPYFSGYASPPTTHATFR